MHTHTLEYNLAERRNEVHIVYNMDEYSKYDKSKKQSHTHTHKNTYCISQFI